MRNKLANLHILKEKVKREEEGLSEYDNIVDGNRPSAILKSFENYLFQKATQKNRTPGRQEDGQIGLTLLKQALTELNSTENLKDGDLLDRLYFQIGKSVRMDLEDERNEMEEMKKYASPEILKIYEDNKKDGEQIWS